MGIELTLLNGQTNKVILEKNLLDYILHDIHYCLSIRDIINLIYAPMLLLIILIVIIGGAKHDNLASVISLLFVFVPVIIQIVIALCYLIHKII